MVDYKQLEFQAMAIELFERKLRESRQLVADVVDKSDTPIIVNFSGGKDSMAMLSLVSEVTENIG